MQFPVFKTKIKGLTKTGDELRSPSEAKAEMKTKSSSTSSRARVFDLNNPQDRREYFELKAGPEIKKLRAYFSKGNTFVAYLLGKKNSGKGTYAKMFAEIVGPENVEHFSIGDMIRNVDQELQDKQKKKALVDFLQKNYRGGFSIKQLLSLLKKRSTATPLLPTELILTLIKREISQKKKKTLFIDGFPRDLDQMNFTLFFRDLIGYRDDPDVFVLINVPEKVIDERMKYRRICPRCQTSRNLKLLPTSKLGYDKKKKEFYLMCDDPYCKGSKMLSKEGDEKGIKPIKARLIKDDKLITQAASLYGIPKVLLRNSVPKILAKEYVDEYEITPEYYYQWDGKKVQVREKPWIFPDDAGTPSYSLLAASVVLSLIKQITKILNI